MSIKCIKCDGEYKLCDGATVDIMPPIEPYKCNKCGDKAWMSDELKTDSFKTTCKILEIEDVKIEIGDYIHLLNKNPLTKIIDKMIIKASGSEQSSIKVNIPQKFKINNQQKEQ